MTKVQKDTLAELMVNFKAFEGATVEEATEKAHPKKATNPRSNNHR